MVKENKTIETVGEFVALYLMSLGSFIFVAVLCELPKDTPSNSFYCIYAIVCILIPLFTYSLFNPPPEGKARSKVNTIITTAIFLSFAAIVALCCGGVR